MRPEKYDYEHLPVGTRVRLNDHKWTGHQGKEATIIEPPIGVFARDDRPYCLVTDPVVKRTYYPYLHEDGWGCDILSPEWVCFDCGDVCETPHFLCNACLEGNLIGDIRINR